MNTGKVFSILLLHSQLGQPHKDKKSQTREKLLNEKHKEMQNIYKKSTERNEAENNYKDT